MKCHQFNKTKQNNHCNGKNIINWLISRPNKTEERISEFEDKLMEMLQTDSQRKKQRKTIQHL